MLVKLGRPFSLRLITDFLRLTRRSSNILKVPFQRMSGTSASPDTKHDAADEQATLAIFMEFIGDPFPIGSTIPLCLDAFSHLTVESEYGEESFFYQTFYEPQYEEGFSNKKFYKLPVLTMERRRSDYFQETQTLCLNTTAEDADELYDSLFEAAWCLIRDERKFVEFGVTDPTTGDIKSSRSIATTFRSKHLF